MTLGVFLEAQIVILLKTSLTKSHWWRIWIYDGILTHYNMFLGGVKSQGNPKLHPKSGPTIIKNLIQNRALFKLFSNHFFDRYWIVFYRTMICKTFQNQPPQQCCFSHTNFVISCQTLACQIIHVIHENLDLYMFLMVFLNNPLSANLCQVRHKKSFKISLLFTNTNMILGNIEFQLCLPS